MDQPYIDQNRIRQVFFLLILLFLGGLLAWKLSVFLPALLGAITLYMVTRKMNMFLVEQKKWKKPLAAWLLMLLTFIIILIPIGILVLMMAERVAFAIDHSNEVVEAVQKLISRVEGKLGMELLNQQRIDSFGDMVGKTVPNLLGATLNSLLILFLMYFILYFMLVYGRQMEEDIYEYIPLKDENVGKLGSEVHTMVWSNAIGIPAIAFLQGVVALIGYLIIGVQEPWFWFVITCIAGMLPVVGAALAYVPLAIIFFANDQTFQGIVMLIFGFGVIGTVDNIFRFTLAKKIGNVHPLITVFGVIIGLQLFGFIGLIFGPLLISLFILLLKIYSNEFIVKYREMRKTTHKRA